MSEPLRCFVSFSRTRKLAAPRLWPRRSSGQAGRPPRNTSLISVELACSCFYLRLPSTLPLPPFSPSLFLCPPCPVPSRSFLCRPLPLVTCSSDLDPLLPNSPAPPLVFFGRSSRAHALHFFFPRVPLLFCSALQYSSSVAVASPDGSRAGPGCRRAQCRELASWRREASAVWGADSAVEPTRGDSTLRFDPGLVGSASPRLIPHQ